MQIPVNRASLTATGKALAMLEPNASICMTTSSRFNRWEGLSSSSRVGSSFFDTSGFLGLLSVDDVYAKAIHMILKDVKTVPDLMDSASVYQSSFQVMDCVG